MGSKYFKTIKISRLRYRIKLNGSTTNLMDGFKITIYYILTHVNCQVSDDGCVNYRNSVI